MAVVLSMLTLVPGGMGGSETYARELLRELAGSDVEVSTLVAPAAAGFSVGVPEQVAPEYPTGASTRARSRALVLGTLSRRRLSRRIAHADVVHYPFTVPVPPRRPEQRSVVSLLDVQHHDLPGMFSRSERAYRRVAYDRAARQSDAVITISHFAKQRIVHGLGIDPAKVHVAHLGVRTEEFVAWPERRESFLLYPAKAWPHKNHATLFEAFRIIRRRHPTLRLVLTGASAGDLPAVPDGVEVRGQVTRSELLRLYGLAAALVFPSLYEGFGLPVIEAMASGCPVAASAAGSVPEIAGDAAVLFEPLNAEGMADAVTAAIDRSNELRRSGLQRASAFTWEACTAVHAGLYARLGDPGVAP